LRRAAAVLIILWQSLSRYTLQAIELALLLLFSLSLLVEFFLALFETVIAFGQEALRARGQSITARLA
jgi:hypothetical protein